MREHRYSVEFPHSPERLWALMQDYDRWTEYAPMVVRVDVLHPGDKEGNGLLRRVIYQMPLGRSGSALELVTEVESCRGYSYRMISREPRQRGSAVDRKSPPTHRDRTLLAEIHFGTIQRRATACPHRPGPGSEPCASSTR